MLGISIIIPIYNEDQIVSRAIKKMVVDLNKSAREYELLLIENGSIDNTKKILRKIRATYPRVRIFFIPGPNFGNAIKKGVTEAKYEHVFLFNIDWWETRFIPRALPLLGKYPIVLGSKQLSRALDHRPLIRKTASRFLTFLLKAFFGFRESDSHGIKAMNRSVVLPILKRCVTNEIIESELLVRAEKIGIPIKELPVTIREVRPARISLAIRIRKVAKELLLLRNQLESETPGPLSLHADDVGLTKENLHIVMRLVKKKALKSVSILSNGPQVIPACKALQKTRIPLFLHFNIVEGRPISNPKNIASIVNTHGTFYPWPVLAMRLFFHRIRPRDIETELSHQLQHIARMGVTISGIDSHQHTHALSPIAEIVQNLASQKNLQVRSYAQMHTTTPYGKVKLFLFRAIAKIISIPYRGFFKEPVTWNKKSWKIFYLASWEKVRQKKSPLASIIVTHPGLPYDHPTDG